MTVAQIQEALNPHSVKQLSFYLNVVDTCEECRQRCIIKKQAHATESIVYIQCEGCLQQQSLLLVNGLLNEAKQRFWQDDCGIIYHKHSKDYCKCRMYR